MMYKKAAEGKRGLSWKYQLISTGCVIALAAVIVFVVSLIFTNITETASNEYAYLYSQDASGKLNTYLNHEIELVRHIATSPKLIDWFTDENNLDKKSRAVDEMIILGSLYYSTELYFAVHESLNEYSIDVSDSASLADFEPFDVIDPQIEYNQWYYRAIESDNDYSLNIDVDKVTGQRRLWINYKVEREGEVAGVFCSGLLFDDIFYDLFSRYGDESVTSYIINEHGMLQMDSVSEHSKDHPIGDENINIRDINSDPDFLAAIDEHISSAGSSFYGNEEPTVLILPSNRGVYASIAPISGTNWTVVTFFNSEQLFSAARLQPLLIAVLISLIMYSIVVIVLGSRQSIYIGQIETAKDDLRVALDEAEAANRAKSRFLANMSHEIRTPMNAILGIAEIQLQKASIQDSVKEAFENIFDSGDLLLGIINDILDLTKIEEGKMEIIPARYDIPSMVHDISILSHLRYKDKPIDFIINLDENTPREVIGDEIRVKQILSNLLSNAFKYTDKGTVEFGIRCAGSTGNKAQLVFTVKDTGQGLTREQISKLFEEYVRFNMDTNRAIAGTGLGLNISKRLIDMIGGKIEVDSEPGEGTTFTLSLPQESAGVEVCGHEIAERLHNFSYRNDLNSKKPQLVYKHMPHGKVLIVDDVRSNLYVAKGLLSPYGLQISEATNGLEAVEKIKEGNVYDLIFMDHMMPKLNGIKATEQIREMGYTAPIVALTANAFVGQKEMFMSKGFDGYVSKPIDSHVLDSFLNKFIA